MLTAERRDVILDDLLTNLRILRAQIRDANEDEEAEQINERIVSQLAAAIELDEPTVRGFLLIDSIHKRCHRRPGYSD